MKRPIPLARIQSAMSQKRRSPAYVWFWENFDKLPRLERRQVNYQEIAEAMADLKIRTRTGKRLTVDNLRKTLQRVTEDKKAEAHITPILPQPSMAEGDRPSVFRPIKTIGEITQPKKPPSQDEDDEPPPRFTFGPSRPK